MNPSSSGPGAELARVELTGGPVRVEPLPAAPPGVLGVDVSSRVVDGEPWTVVQVLVDDDHPGLAPTLLDGPMVAELASPDGSVSAREPFDHDAFRRRLQAERDAGESTARGVLVLNGGESLPRWVRLAFLPVPITATEGEVLVVRPTTVAELVAGVEQAFARGEVADADRRALLLSIEHRHPST